MHFTALSSNLSFRMSDFIWLENRGKGGFLIHAMHGQQLASNGHADPILEVPCETQMGVYLHESTQA